MSNEGTLHLGMYGMYVCMAMCERMLLFIELWKSFIIYEVSTVYVGVDMVAQGTFQLHVCAKTRST